MALAKKSFNSLRFSVPSESSSCLRNIARNLSSSKSLKMRRTPAANSFKLRIPSPSTSKLVKIFSRSFSSLRPNFLKPLCNSDLLMLPSRFSSKEAKNLTIRSAWCSGNLAAISKSRARFNAVSSPNFRSSASCWGCTVCRTSAFAENHLWSKQATMVGRSVSVYISMLRHMSLDNFDVFTLSQFGPCLCRALQSLGSQLRAQKGTSPASNSYRTQPRDQTSHLGPKVPIQTSGAIVVGVPAIILPLGSEEPNISETPRSIMTAWGEE
mmetsp:Transcript_102793/g.257883  ORF Transcript_102793/g.257883 Transcript_102793/m.257883 type:complete len:268 (+) Transcript_102793:265-1068(+)